MDAGADDAAEVGREGLGLPLRVALVLGPLVVLLALVEGALVLLGLGEPSRQHTARGFDSALHYLTRGDDGAWHTRLFDDPEREQRIPPRDERKRVLLFGGSNTQLFPEVVLEDLLNGVVGRWAAAGDDDAPLARTVGAWEVINLGREGYGSARVAILVEQACAALRPDVVVIYSGNNEFVELGFREELERSGVADGWVARTLGGLRTFGVLREAFESGETVPVDVVQDPAQRPVSRAENAAVWERYRENLTRMCAAAGEAGAEVVLCTVLGNLLSPPFVGPSAAELGPQLADDIQGMRNRGMQHIPEAFRAGLRPPERLRVRSWYRRRWTGDLDPEYVPPALRPLTGPLAEGAASSGPDSGSVAGAHWPDPAGWGDDARALMETVARVLTADTSDLRAQLERARSPLRNALERAPEHAHVLYDMGLLTWLLGDSERAVRWFKEAQNADRAPHCANELSNAVVRQVAAEQGARLADVVWGFQRGCPDGLVSYELLMDHCHLQPGARIALMRQLASMLPGLLGDR